MVTFDYNLGPHEYTYIHTYIYGSKRVQRS
jgi:hypothetical protein